MTFWNRLADLTSRTTERVFGQPVQYARKSADPEAEFQDVSAIFDPTHVYSETEGGTVAVTSQEVTIDVRHSEIGGEEPGKGDQIKANGQLYTAIDRERLDGDTTRLVLQQGERGRL